MDIWVDSPLQSPKLLSKENLKISLNKSSINNTTTYEKRIKNNSKNFRQCFSSCQSKGTVGSSEECGRIFNKNLVNHLRRKLLELLWEKQRKAFIHIKNSVQRWAELIAKCVKIVFGIKNCNLGSLSTNWKSSLYLDFNEWFNFCILIQHHGISLKL